jgi:hypothetical protein
MVVDRRPERALAHAAPLVPLTALVAALGLLAPLSPWFRLAPILALGALLAYGVAIAVALHPGRREPHPFRLRALVAALHVAQPFVRTWGRIRGRPVDAPEPAGEAWSGDRAEWLDGLRRELAGRRCRVRDGVAHDSWDLALSVGPLVTCRMTTAVAWSWTPLQRLSLRPKAAAFAAVALAAVAAWFEPAAGAALLAAAGVAAAVEVIAVRRVVRDTFHRTTAGSKAGGP